ncbi:MAG: hypothetical protein AAFP97_10345 [Pseudomonadota bacterium]
MMTTVENADLIPPKRALWKIWGKRFFLGWLLFMLVGTAANWRNIYAVATFNPFLFGPDYPKPTSAAEARDQDFDYLLTLTEIDRSFSPEAAKQFQTLLQTQREDLTASPEADFLAMAEAVALADNGHTNLTYSPLWHDFASIDLRFSLFADGIFITEAAQAHAALIGQRAVALDNRPIAEVKDGLAQYRGGNAVWRLNIVPSFLITPSVLHAAGLTDQPDQITFTLADTEGVETIITLDAGSPAAERDTENWVKITRPDDSALPVTLQDWRAPVSRTLPHKGHYVRMPQGFRAGDQSIKAFLQDVYDGLAAGSQDYLIADFRGNSGGNYGLSAKFAKQISDRLTPDGTLYLVTDKDTFSAAIVITALIKYHSESRAVIIGEPMGDREAFWAERGKTFRLPNRGWYVNYATGFHDWGGECQRERYCFTRNIPHDVAAGSLAPDVDIPMTFEDYKRGRDPVLDYILAAEGAL